MSKAVAKYLVVGGLSAGLLSFIVGSDAKVSSFNHAAVADVNDPLVAIDTPITTLPYDFEDESTGDPLNYPNSGGLKLNNPSNVTTSTEYDPATGNYEINQKMGGGNYRPPTYMDNEEYQNYMFKKQVKKYWNARSDAETQTNKNKPLVPKLNVGGEIFDRIFGGNTVDIRPNGSAELIFAYNGTTTANPAIPERNRKVNTFDFNERIQLNVVGKIGDKLKLTTSYNTEATFDFENQMKLEYAGYEDDIIKKIEAGNVSMPLTGSLITGSQTLFGVKTQLQFGRLTVTGVLSQQKGKKSEVEVTGGAQISKFEVAGDAYEANRHFFLAQYFRDQYNSALSGLPFVNSPVNINRIEIWISNVNTATTDIRSVVAFSELAEDSAHIPANQTYVMDISPSKLPYNGQNNLYGSIAADSVVRTINTTVSKISAISGNTLKQTINYELIASARKLQPAEFTLNTRLGFISLNQQLNPDQALAVAYQYTINGQVYQVGEFSDGGISAPKAIYTKMLKSTAINTKHPMWHLMMKNVYSLGAFQITAKDFKLNVLYNNLQTGTNINYLPVPASETNIHGKTLLQVLNLDRLNQQNDQIADGVFDFIDGVTINANNGRVIFPVVEPFGEHLRSKFMPSGTLANSYVFDQLYDSTKIVAQQFPQLNRFTLKGTYASSSSSDISLGAPNVPQGSVSVTAGGVRLTENVDYTVDYTLGRVKIINDGILNSGTPIKIGLESNALFAIQQKTLMASHFDYKINKDFNLGATIMGLTERPLTQKVNIGDEAVRNVIWGLDGNYRTEAPFLTRFVDRIPFIQTKEMSTITATAEYAYLIPGHSKAIGAGREGSSYIDDFEGSQTTIDMRSQNSWTLASTPQGQTGLFPEGNLADSLPYGYNRAKLAWYVIDPLFLRQTASLTPPNITDNDMSNNFTREVPETEVFPNKPIPSGLPPNIATLDMAYYPGERGPYNYDAAPVPGISSGLDANGNLKDPQTRWGGVMRAIQTNDFELANVEYIQFWVMDPFNSDNATINPSGPNTTGDLYFNIGNVSEDILRDNHRSAENGLPTPAHPATTVVTPWGVVPDIQPLVNTFNNDPAERPLQDVGLDGLGNTTSSTEQSFFAGYLNSAQSIVTPAAYTAISTDPSNDDFHYFRGSDYDAANIKTLERYKKFNGMENNSRTIEQSQSIESYPISATLMPNVEDINRDNNLSTAESYFQYHISLKPSDFASGVGTNYITNVYSTSGQNIKNGTPKPITWYQFRIPVKSPEGKVGSIENFQSIRFIRMFFKNVDKPVILRFARLELVRSEWRKYGFDLLQPGIYIPNDDASTQFDVAAVSIEVDGSKQPVNYVLPPNINRQINAATANLIALNEQAMSLTVCNLKDGQTRAAFKNTSLDVRSYKKLLMHIHAEASPNTNEVLYNNNLHAIVRLGTDYTDNYYEYDIPLLVTAPGNYNGTNVDDQYRVWPEANEMVLEFAKLQAAKLQRNGTGVNINTEYTVMDGTRKITVKGNPNLSAIKTLMIGIRNPKLTGNGEADDGLQKCAQIWVNELRLSDFDEEGGGAATARVTAKLADFGTLSLSGNWYAPGFGSLENKVSERKRETLKQYDITSSFELGKFLPTDVKIHLPMFAGYSETFITPQFDPLNPDIILAQELKDPNLSDSYRDSLRLITVDYTKRRSINFINVKKEKGKNSKKSHIYDVSNLSASYSYSEIYKRNINLLYDSTRNYKGGLMYSFSPTPTNFKPFAKTKILQSKHLTLIKDANFYLFPNKLGFSADVERFYNTQEVRNVTAEDMIIIPTFNKRFTMIRNYDLKYDITKALKLDFIATNDSRILEPQGAIDTREKKDTLWNNFYQGGKTTSYNQQLNVNYAIPINKLPLLDFTTASARYTGTYNWLRAPFGADTLGNTIQNSAAVQYSGQMNMLTLYNKIPYFKKINQNANKKTKDKSTTKVPPLKDKDGKIIKYTKAQNDSIKKANKEPSIVLEYVARVIMSLKNVNATYSTNEGTILPGYSHFTNMVGMDKNFAGPTPGFVFGDQKDIRGDAIKNHWLVKTQSLNTPYVRTSSQNMNIRANVEPMPDLKIELTALQTKSLNHSEFFKWRPGIDTSQGSVRYPDGFVGQSPIETGNFSMSFLSFNTSFKNGEDVFNNFLAARSTISMRLGAQNDSSRTKAPINGYANGYNATSQDVLIPAFIAAYSGTKSDKVGMGKVGTFPSIPKPNWRITYDGLSKLEAVKKYFKTITLSHAYRSTYNVSSYATNLLFKPNENQQEFTGVKELVSSIPTNRNFLAKNLINTITVSEQWSPLIRVDITLNNSVLINVEYKKDRNLSLGLTSKTVTEVAGREIVIGLGYRLKDVSLGKKLLIKGKPIKSDLNLKSDLSFRKNETAIRRIVEEVSQTTAGSNIISIKVSADYVINERINIRLFYDRIINHPVISNSFATTNTNAGISLRLSLSN